MRRWIRVSSFRSSIIFLISLAALLVSCRATTSSRSIQPITPRAEVDWVDPFINTKGDNGQMYPGAVCPFGLVKLSPDTNGLPHSGYYYEKEEIHGFSHLRVGGTGCDGAGGNILIKPGVGDLTDFERYHKKFYDKSAIRYSPFYKEAYNKSSERAKPGYYKVEFQSGIKAELTASTRVGFHRYTFPAFEQAYILVDLSRTYELYGMLDASLKVENSNEISGMFKSLNVCGWGYPKVRDQNPHYKLYYAIKFDKDFDSFKTWENSNIEKGVRNRRGPNIGLWVNFSTSQGEVIQAKVGISAISMEQAKFERDNEISGWDFAKAKNDARCAWQRMLEKVEIPEGRPDLKTIFYTKLYHSYLMPSNVTSSLGTYRAARDEHTLRFTSDTAEDYVYYSGWSLWDDFRKYMLISLTEPDVMQNIARSLVDYYKTRGEYVFWSTGYWPCPSVRQEFTTAVVLDAYQKGLGKFDPNAAFEGMKTDVDNFEAENVGAKLEKAYQAYLVMKMAEHLGRKADYEKYRAEALSYRNHWNPTQKDDQGNVRGFFTLNKEPVDSVEPWGCCYEGNSWHYRWFVFHDMKGFVSLRGSRDLLADDLEYFFEQNLYMHLNEPDMHAPFLFDYLGKPYLTQKWARAFTTKVVTQRFHNHGFYEKPVVRRIYRADPEGYIPTMDDDVGAMSSWFVMSAMGLFPGVPGDPYYLIGSPVFPEIRLHLKGGKVFTIKANNVSEDNFYIQSASLNGCSYNKPWIEYSTIISGGKLEFEMGPKPNKSWGSEPANAPPSLSR